ncbi:MAG: hypothetical protein WD055_00675 [Candidatus Dependentiae bacterium]
MKRIYILSLVCFIYTVNHAMFSGLNLPPGKGKEMAQAMQNANERKQKKEGQDKQLDQATMISRPIIQALHQTEQTLETTVGQLDTLSKKRITQLSTEIVQPLKITIDATPKRLGDEVRESIKSSTAHIFKGFFCSVITGLGALLSYQNLKEHSGELKSKETVMATIGTTFIAAAALLGNYWLH